MINEYFARLDEAIEATLEEARADNSDVVSICYGKPYCSVSHEDGPQRCAFCYVVSTHDPRSGEEIAAQVMKNVRGH